MRIYYSKGNKLLADDTKEILYRLHIFDLAPSRECIARLHYYIRIDTHTNVQCFIAKTTHELRKK